MGFEPASEGLWAVSEGENPSWIGPNRPSKGRRKSPTVAIDGNGMATDLILTRRRFVAYGKPRCDRAAGSQKTLVVRAIDLAISLAVLLPITAEFDAHP